MTFADTVFILWLTGLVLLILRGAVSLYQSHKDIKEIERKMRSRR